MIPSQLNNLSLNKETIILSDLKNIDNSLIDDYFENMNIKNEIQKKYPNKSKEELEIIINEHIHNKMNILKKESLKYYQINNEKSIELEQIFKQIKLKIKFGSIPIIRDGKFYTISKGVFTMYNDKFYNKLYEIKFSLEIKIESAIQLDNKDLVFFLMII